MTIVVNMLGGSGLGKSTTAAGLYHRMKMEGKDVELVREYVKGWAWENRKVGQYDQIYIFGKQAKSEYALYNKVDYIITDSPIVLSPVYERFYNDGESMIEEAAIKFLNKAEKNGIKHINFLLERNKPFNPAGRYETEEQARQVDIDVREFLADNGLMSESVRCSDEERISFMMDFFYFMDLPFTSVCNNNFGRFVFTMFFFQHMP